ncbi:MAG: DUF3575 domain-containing protein [Prevotella sp.]|nr:DUF3575 domain-containing protein [Prevotella sp.]MBR0166820.1 DUF3575 domain-containing protein [Prevotella sp.]
MKVRFIDKLAVSFVALVALTSVGEVKAQTFAVKNNLLYDVTLTPNLGFDLKVDSLWTVGAVVGLNAWDINKDTNKKWRHVLVEPNFRRWLNGEAFHKRYIEGDLIYSHYNVGNTRIPFGLYGAVKDRRLQGDLLALGGKYGYSWIMARHWRIEAEAGIAVGYAWFKEYECPACGMQLGEGDRIFLLPQLGVNIVYIIN